MKKVCILQAVLVLFAAACSSTETKEEKLPAVDHGKYLFGSKSSSDSKDNFYSCATCHRTSPGGARVYSGAPLGGVTERPSYWGGTVLDLLAAVNACRTTFMDAHDPWDSSDENAKAMFAYLKSLPPDTTTAVPFTVVRTIVDVPNGDAARGAQVYERACLSCHGGVHTAEGRLSAKVPRLPEQTIAEHAGYSPRDVRLVFVEKVRHGAFLGYGGRMPPLSTELFSDQDMSDLLAHLGL